MSHVPRRPRKNEFTMALTKVRLLIRCAAQAALTRSQASPDLFGVGLEELAVQAPPEGPGGPAFEGVEVLCRMHANPK